MNKYIVEFLGTMLLVTVIIATGNYLAVGATLALIVFLGAPISGASYNPAVTFALYNSGQLQKEDIIPYTVVQILGALAAYEVYKRFIK